MHNYQFGAFGGASDPSAYGQPDDGTPPKHSIFSLVVMIVVIAVLATAGIGIAFWALGFLFDLAGWILKIAVLTVVAGVGLAPGQPPMVARSGVVESFRRAGADPAHEKPGGAKNPLPERRGLLTQVIPTP